MRIPEKPPPAEESPVPLLESNIEVNRPYLNIINSEYLHWDELKVDNRFKGVDLKQLWRVVQLFRDYNARLIKINGLILRYVPTPRIEKTLHDLDVRVAGKLDLEAQITGPELQKKYLVNSLMEEAIASSQLEGAVTTRAVAKKMLRENRKPRNPSEQMIVNNYVTMRHIKEHTEPNQKLTLDLIKEIHKRITKDTFERKEYEGVFRTDNEVKVFAIDEPQIIYEPPDYTRINQFLEDLCKFVNSESEGYYLHPFVKAIILHYMMGYIHPFNDGNGRTARALLYWYLISQKYDYFEYVAVSTAIKNAPAQYARAYLYTETDNNDITYFIKFNLRAFDNAVSLFEKYIQKTRTENKKIFEAVRQDSKLNFRQADILVNMSKTDRPITISELEARYHITYQTARTDLLALAKRDYLQRITKGKRFFFILNKDKCIDVKINAK